MLLYGSGLGDSSGKDPIHPKLFEFSLLSVI